MAALAVLARLRALARGRPAGGSLLSSAGLVLMGDLASRALAFLFPVVLAHSVARDDFALVYFFISTGFLVSQIVLTGFPTAMTRYIAAETDPGRRAGWAVSALIAGVPLACASIAAGAVLAVSGDAPPGLMAAMVVGLSINAYYIGLLRGLRRFRMLAAYRVLSNLAQILLLLAAVAAGVVDVTVAVVIYSFVYLVPIAALELAPGVMRSLGRADARPSRERVRRLARFGGLTLVTGLAWGVINGGDAFFVRLFAPETLADYGAAKTLTVPLLLVPFALSVVLMPSVASAPARERMRLLRRAVVTTGAVAVVGVAGYVVLGGVAVSVAFPSSYEGAADLVVRLAPGLALLGMYAVLSDWWIGVGRPAVPAGVLVAGAAVSVCGHLLLTARHGASGAALALGAGSGAALGALGVVTLLHVRRAARASAGDGVTT